MTKNKLQELAKTWIDKKVPKIRLAETENALQLWDDNGMLDQHFKPEDRADFVNKSARMLFKQFGWYGAAYTTDQDIAAKFIELFLTLCEEYAYEYLSYTNPVLPENNWNYALARSLGYTNYKKLVAAGFQRSFAANTAVQFELLKNNPDRGEIFDILGIQFK